ncbi:MAG: hypothetical protein AAF329_21305 [Cyanobacteria bacterium P01_A01_bin.17]
MPRKTSEQLLAEANQRLKAGHCAVKINQQGGRLYLRGTLPPKKGSGKTSSYQQRITRGYYFNPAGIKRAEADANQVNRDLMMGQFNWKTWSAAAPTNNSVAQWVDRFEKEYFTIRERNAKSETTWAKDYRSPFRKLPQQETLTADLLIKVAKTYPPDTRSRQRACTAYTALAEFAAINIDLTLWRGKYRPTAVKREDVPGDELIVEWYERISHPGWQAFYGLVATYGLRNHEAFHLDLAKLKMDPIATVQEGKTGYRPIVLPCHKVWWDEWFAGRDIVLPEVKASSNSHYGNVSSQYFRRLGLPFKIYDLRHAHAGRMALKGIDPAIAARAQGHSLQVHSQIYMNYLNADSLRGLLDQL